MDRTLRWELAALPLAALLVWAAFGHPPGSVALATLFFLAVVVWVATAFAPARDHPRQG